MNGKSAVNRVSKLRKWASGNWFVPTISGVLIVVSIALENMGGGSANPAVGLNGGLMQASIQPMIQTSPSGISS